MEKMIYSNSKKQAFKGCPFGNSPRLCPAPSERGKFACIECINAFSASKNKNAFHSTR